MKIRPFSPSGLPFLLPLVAFALSLAFLLKPRSGSKAMPDVADISAQKPGKAGKSKFVAGRIKERLKPFDLRESRAADSFANDRETAIHALRQEVPGVSIDFDAITGAPKQVMAAGRFLSRAKGTADKDDAYATVRDFIERHAGLFGHNAGELVKGRARVTREDVSAHNGMRTVVWQQEVAGIPVFEAILKANLTKGGDLITLGSHFMSNAPKAATPQLGLTSIPPLNAARALAEGVVSLGVTLDTSKVTPKVAAEGVEQMQRLSAPGLTDTTAHLTWVPMDESTVRLAWQFETFCLAANEMFRLLVDVEDGRVLVRQSLTTDISNASYRVYTSDSPSPFSPGHDNISSVQPPVVPRQLVTIDALNATASPNGWINDGGTETVGNNVDAHTDTDANNSPDLPRPTSVTRVFDFPVDLAQAPSTYKDAAVTNLFYWSNVFHDRMYSLGFTESAGNFQTSNFGRGGVGNDPVQADAQDGSGTDNANFSTPSDGSSGRMQMFLWTGPNPDRDGDFEMEVVLHELTHGVSNRLVGGGVGISANVTGGMGEGWSDFVGLAMLAEPGDNINGNWARGGYSRYLLSGTFTENYYYGGRRYPYSTNMTKNPLTFKDIDPAQRDLHAGIPINPMVANTADQVHNMGNVWCVTLWDVRANLITKHGWPGNELALQLVIDGMKLSPANPNFLQARDAIIQADLVNNAGANRNELWAAFAKRGMGYSASSPASSTTVGLVEAYDIPDDLGVSPSTTLAATGQVGGPFSPSSRVFTLQNTGAAALNWTATTSQPWLVLSRASGSLASSATDTVTLSISSAANSLPVGTYTGVVTFTNTTSSAAIQRNVSLTMEPVRIPILSEPFDSSTLSSAWTVTGTGPYRTQVTALNGPRTSNHLTMDSSVDVTYARNEATLTVNLAAQTNVELTFWAKGFSEDANGPPSSPFINGADFDGVAISADGGTTWWEVQPLRSLTTDWVKYTVDLDAAIAARGLSYNANFKIRFNQYDNYGIATDGIAIDDILVARTVTNTLALALPVSTTTEGASPITATLAVSPTPSSPLTVNLSASTEDVTMPSSVTVPAGSTQITFPVTVVDDTLLDGSQKVMLTAQAPTFISGSASLVVQDNETTMLTVSAPLSGTEGSSEIACTVSIAAPAGAAVTVALDSSDPAAKVPLSVIIPEGQSAVEFFVALANDPYINGPRSVTFTASVTGWTAGSDTMAILDDESHDLSLVLTLPAIAETDGLRAGAGRVSINGLMQTDLVVSLVSNDTSELTVPATVTIPAGSTQALFDVTAMNDSDADGPQNVTITASAAGLNNGTLAVTVNDDEAAPVAWNPRPVHLSVNNPISTDLAWSVSEGNLIVNGDFESGNLTGWTTNSPGGPMFRLQNGYFDPPGSDTPTPPYAGTFSMIFAASTFGGIWSLWQDFTVPADGPVPVLQWMQRVRNTGSSYTVSQQYRVEVRDPATDLVLGTLWSTQPGDALFQDWTARSADLKAWRGRTVRLAFVVTQSSAVLNVLLDEIKLEQRPATSNFDVYFGTNPTPGAAELAGNTTATQWPLPDLTPGTTYYWRVVTKNGAQVLPGPVWQFSVPPVGSVSSFFWSSIVSPQSAGADFPVTVRALDEAGNTATSFDGPATIQAVLQPVTQPSVLITEHSAWTTDEWEFTNVTNAAIDVSGWKVLVTHANSFPAPYLTFTIPNGTTVTAGGIFRVMESGTAPGVYPLFRTGTSTSQTVSSNAFTVLLNARGEVVDFVCIGGDPRQVTLSLPVEAWRGSSLPVSTTNPGGLSWQRTGNRDNQNATDWQFAVATPGVMNTGLTLPFASGPAAPAVSPTNGVFVSGVWAGNVRVLGGTQNLRLRASASGKSGESNLFTTTAPGGQLTLTAGASAAEGDGTLTNFGTVTLPAAAVSAVTVNFIIDSTSQASAASVTIPAGSTSANYDLTVTDDVLVEGPHGITIVASAQDFSASNPATVALTDNEGAALSISAPVSVTEGQAAQTITITAAAAPLNAVTVTLASSDTTEATLPATVSLPAGQTSVTASLSIVNDTLLDGAQNVTLTASSPGFTSGTAAVTVNDNEPATVTLSAPATITEDAGILTAAGTVTLGGVAPADVNVTLSSSDATSLVLPATVTVPSGQSSATFAITAVNDSAVEANATVTLTASAGGLTNGTAAVTVRDDDLAAFAFGNVASPQNAAKPFAVTVTARNTSADVITGFTGTVALDAPGNAITPMVTSAFVSGVWTGNVTLSASAASQTLTATSGAFTGASNAFTVDAATLASFEIMTVASPQLVNTPFSFSATAKDALNQAVMIYAGTPRLVQLGVPQLFYTGTFASSTTTNLPVLTSGYNRERSVMLVRAAEMSGARQLTSLGFHMLSAPPALSRFIVRLKATALTAVSSSDSWDNAGWQTVYDAAWNVTNTGWADIAFTAPFFYNGTSNLLMEIIHVNPSDSTWNASLTGKAGSYTAVAYSPVSSSNTVNADPTLWTGTTPSKSSSATRPLMRFNSRVLSEASPATLAFLTGTFTGSVSAPYGGTGQALGVWDVEAGVLSVTNDFTVSSAGALAVTFSGNTSEGGAGITGTVTAPTAPSSNLAVNLSAADATDVSLPASVTIPAGMTTVTFAVSAVDDSLVEPTETIKVAAAGPGYDAGTGSFTITDNDAATLSVVLPSNIAEGAAAATGTVSTSAVASFDLTISLAASPAGLVTVPASVTLPAGQTSATFTISAVNNTVIDGTRSATITASATGLTSGSGTLDVLDNEAPTLTVTVTPTNPSEGAGTASGTVTLSGTTSTALTVNLSSDDTSEATVPASVTIAAGASSATFTVTLVDDTLTDGTQPVAITASATGFTNGTRVLQVLDNDVAAFAFATVPGPQVRNAPFAVTINAVDVNGVVIPTFTGSAMLFAAGNAGAITVNPATTGAFVNGVWTGSVTLLWEDAAVKLTADIGGGVSGQSNAFDVLSAGAVSQFAIGTISSPQVGGTAVPVTVTAQDAAGNSVTSYNGNVSFSIIGGPSSAEIVTSTGTSTTTNLLPTTVHDSRQQSIYLPSEAGGARTLRSLAIDISTVPGQVLNAFTIRLKHTTKADYSATGSNVFETTGWTTVYQANQSITTTGWNTFTFQNSFFYNGADNLMVDISYNNSSAASTSGSVRHTSTATSRVLVATSNSSDGDPLLWNGSVGPSSSTTTSRPNLRLSGFVPVTVSPVASGTFASGVWTGEVTFAGSGTGIALKAVNGAGFQGQSSTFTVNGASLDHFEFASIASPQTVGASVPVTVTARDANNMLVSGFVGTAALSGAEQALKAQTGSGTSSSAQPMGSSNRAQRMQVIYTAAELGAVARSLTGLDLNPTTAPGAPLTNFTIRVKHTTKADFTAAGTAVWESSGWTTVFQGNVSVAEPGWVSFPFTAPFEYDGTRNLMVDYSYNNGANTTATTGSVRCTSAATNRAITRGATIDEGDPLTWHEWTAPSPTASTLVPNARFASGVPAEMTPTVTGVFTGGVWTGNVTVNEPKARVEVTASASGRSGTSSAFDVNALGALALSLAATAAEGDGPLTATVTRSGDTSAALTVNLASSDATEATLSAATVTIPAGSASAAFTVNVLDDAIVDGPQSVIITASAGDYVTGPATLSVADNEPLTLTLWIPANLTEASTSPGNAYVTINRPAASAVTVALASSDTTELTLPASVTIAAGSTSASMAMTVVNDTLLDGPQSVTVTATAAGYATGSATTIVQDNEAITMSIGTTSLVENDGPTATTVTLTGTTAVDVPVTITVNDPSSLLVAPDTSTPGSNSITVTVPANASSAAVALVPVDDGVKDGNKSVTVTLAAPGFTTTQRFVSIVDNELDRYFISPVASPQTANAAFSVTVTAQNIDGSTITNHPGSLSLSAANAAGALAMTPATATFSGGLATVNALFNIGATGVTITATDAQSVSAQSSVFDVVGTGGLARFDWSTLASPQLIENPFTATVTAKDAAGNTLNTYSGPANLKVFATAADTTIGTGTTSWFTPLGTGAQSRTQGIYLASELGVAKRLTGLALNVVSSTSTVFNNFVIRLKHTSSTSFSSASWDNSGWTTVFTGTRTFSSTGWQNTVFARPFDFDGVSNLMVDISFANASSVVTSVGLQASTTASARSVALNTTTSSFGMPTTWTGTSPFPSTSTNLLNVRFTNATPVATASSGAAQVTVGTGTSSTSWPLGTFYHDQRTQMIYTAAELGSAMNITSVALDVSTLPAQVMNAFTIRMKHTSVADYSTSAAWESTGWTTVYSSTQTVSATGWNTFNLTTPFAFNGTSNLMVDICFNNSSYTSNGACRYSTTPTSRVISYQTDSGYGDPLTWTGTSNPTPSPSTSLPNMRFSGTATVATAAISPTVTGGFTAGSWTGGITALQSGASIFFAADDPATGIAGYSNAVAINASGTLALTFLGTLTESSGTVANGGTLTLSAAPASSLTVNLSSASTANLTVPATITVPAGQTSIPIPVTIINDTAIEGPHSVAVTAIAPGYTRVTTSANIADNDGGIFTITAPASVAEGSASFTATLTASATSPVAVTVSLTSSDTTELTVPSSVTLPANASSVNFTVTVADDTIVDGSQNATLTASATNWTSGTATVSVTDNDPPPAITLFVANLAEGGTYSFNYVSLASAPVSNLVVTLVSDDPSTLSVPATVTVAAGSSTAYFVSTAGENALPMGTLYPTVTATAAGYRSAASLVTVTDNDPVGYRIGTISGTPVAGAPVNVTVTAIAADGSTVSSYAGNVTFTASGTGGPVPVTPAASGTFSSGVWTGNLTFGQVTTGVVLTASDTLGRTGQSNAFNTTFAALDHFAWAAVPSPQAAATPFSATITAKDAYENTVTSYVGSTQVTALKPGAMTTSGVGTGSNYDVLAGTYDDVRSTWIYRPSEVGGAKTMGGIWLNVTSPSSSPFTNFSIRMKHTGRSNYATGAAWESSGWTTVYRGAPAFGVTGWTRLAFSAPFTYNGSENLLVDISWDTASGGTGVTLQSTSASPARGIHGNTFTSSGYGNPLNWNGTSPSALTSLDLPNLRFEQADTVVALPTSSDPFVGGIWNGLLMVAQSGTGMRLVATDGVTSGASAFFDVTAAGTLSLSLPANATEGDTPLTAALSITAAPGADLTVMLLSTNNGAATVPASVVIPAGQTSTTFPVSIIDDGLLDGTQNTTIVATVAGLSSGVSTLSVLDNETTSITLTLPSTLAENSAASTGTVTLGAPAGLAVTLPLSSSDTSELMVPARVTIPAGGTSATFVITPVDDAVIDLAQVVTVTTSMAGWTGGSAGIQITDNESATATLSFTSSVSESQGTLSASLSTPSPVESATVFTLTSADTTEATVPANVTIAAGASSASFSITIVNDTLKDGSQTFAINAVASGFTTASRNLTVTDNDVHNFLVSAVASPQVRNVPFNVTFTARDVNNVTITGYSGTPTLSAADGATALTASPTTLSGFSSGVRTQAVTVSSSASNAIITVTDATTGGSGSSNAFVVGIGALHHFAMSAIPTTVSAGSPQPVTITAQDVGNNTVTSFTQTANLSITDDPSTVIAGTGTTNWSIPLGSQSRTQRMQVIYLASEVGAARVINNLSLYVDTVPGSTLSNFTIRMKHTTATSYSSAAWDNSNWMTVYQANTAITATGWKQFDISSFNYDGTSSLMIDFSYYNAATGATQGYTRYTAAATNRTVLLQTDTDYGSPLTWSGTSNPSPVMNTVVPNVRFGTLGGSFIAISPTVTGAFSSGIWSGSFATAGNLGNGVKLRATSGSITGASNAFNVIGTTISISALPSSAVESAGTVTGTVTLSAAQAADTTVTLTSTDATEAVPATSSLTVPAGATSANFTVNIINDALADGAQTVTIWASAVNMGAFGSSMVVTDDDLGMFTFSTIASPKNSGVGFSITINARTIDNSPATAFNGSTANLSAVVNGSAATITPAVTGAFSSASWTGNVSVQGAGSATITATSGSATGTSNAFTLTGPALSVTLPATAVESAGSVSGTVGISATQATATNVTLSSSDTTEANPAASIVVIPAGATSVPFTLNIIDDTLKDGVQNATITATAASMTSGSAVISVKDDDLHNFLVSSVASPQLRGVPFNVTFTARTFDNQTLTTYAGTPTLNGVDGVTALSVSPGTVGSFSGGTRTVAVTVGNTAAAAVLTLTDASAAASGSSASFAVNAPVFHHFSVSSIPSPQIAGQAFPVTITAQDSGNNTLSDFTGPTSLEITNFSANGRVSIGTASGTSPMFYNTTSPAARSQHIYPLAELGGPIRIRGLTFTVSTALASTLSNFTIRLKHTTLTTFTASYAGFEDTGWTTVFSGTLGVLSAGVIAINFNSPFDYDGVNNLMLDFSFTNVSGGGSAGALSTFTGSGLRSAVITGSATPPITTYGTTMPVAPISAVPVIAFMRDLQVSFTPSVTGVFTAGVWTGNVTVTTPAVGLKLRPGGSTTRQSNAFDVLPSAPTFAAEPAFTGGMSNTLSWSAVPSASTYQIQAATSADFSSLFEDCGAITAFSRTFGPLLSGQIYHYRSRASASAVSMTGIWSQTQISDFAVDAVSATAIRESASEVRLARNPVVVTENFDGDSLVTLAGTLFSDVGSATATKSPLTAGPNATPALPINQGGDVEARISGLGAGALMPSTAANIFSDGSIEAYVGPESTSSPLFYTGLLLRASRVTPGGPINGYLANVLNFTGGTASVSIVRVVNGTDAGGINGILYPSVSLPSLAANEHWKVRFTAAGPVLTVLVWKVTISGGVVTETLAATVNRTDYAYSSGVAGLYSGNSASGTSLFDDVTVTMGNGTFVASGTITSPAIAPSSKLRWGTLSFNATTPLLTILNVDVLNGTTNALLAASVPNGSDLNTFPAVAAVNSIKLRANLGTTDGSITPALLDWSLTYPLFDGAQATSGWSAAASSTQDATPPVVGSIPWLTTSGSAASVSGTASDDVSGVSSVTVAGNAAATGDQFAHWNSAISGLTNGSNSITVIATDKAVPPNTTTTTAFVFRVATPSADSDSDGISDLMSHALGIQAGDASPRSKLPTTSVETDGGTGQKFLVLEYRRRIQRAGLIYKVETSGDLTTWNALGGDVVEESVTPVGDGVTETVRVRVTPSVDLGGSKFVRLNVTVQ